ncbi:5-formyltetrahydrofolate cyclo-ligase [Firmicutes bacterium M10-2]|nr:5-formyltetrahydrofolate cyclo-ligase [Firmicutes bacterium M10-2]
MIPLDRKQIIEERKIIKDRTRKEKAIVEKLLPFLQGKSVAGYMAIRGEASLKEIALDYIPKIIDDQTMIFLAPDHLEKGTLGIMEPSGTEEVDKAKIDVMLVPMVAFQYPYRIGYGKGYYDRYLKDFQGLKIGVAFDMQEVSDYVPNRFDQKMDMIVTETRIIDRETEKDIGRAQ